MKTVLGLICIVAGIALFFQGINRRDSLAGHADAAATNIANAVDGGTRTSRHMGYMIGGGALVLVGIGVMSVRRGPRTTTTP